MTGDQRLIIDDLLVYGSKVEEKGDQLVVDGTALTRQAATKPAPMPELLGGADRRIWLGPQRPLYL